MGQSALCNYIWALFVTNIKRNSQQRQNGSLVVGAATSSIAEHGSKILLISLVQEKREE